MIPMIEVAPEITDTEQDKEAMIRDARQFALDAKQDDDFLVVPPEDLHENELFEESSSIFTVDGKHMEFDYISSFNKNGQLISFAQDPYGVWWSFSRTGLTDGKGLKGPYSTKEKLLKSLGL